MTTEIKEGFFSRTCVPLLQSLRMMSGLHKVVVYCHGCSKVVVGRLSGRVLLLPGTPAAVSVTTG